MKILSVLFGLQGAKDLEKELKTAKNEKPAIAFMEAVFAERVTPKNLLLNKKIQKRIEEDWKYGKLKTDLDNWNVVFWEALEAIVTADPFVADTAEEITNAYEDAMIEGRSVFSALYAETEQQVDKIQAEMQQFLETGKRKEAEQNINRILESGIGYANNVFRTNASTAYSIGRQIKEKPLVESGYIVGYELLTVGDGRVRGKPGNVYGNKGGENHWAFHGTRVKSDNPILDGLTPPLGYQCRCHLRAISKYVAKHEELLDKEGNFIEYYPPTFSQGNVHEGFGRRFN